MTNLPTWQCKHCGRFNQGCQQYFSHQHALCYSRRKPRHVSFWCYACSHLTITRPRCVLGIEFPFFPIVEAVSCDHFLLASQYGSALDEYGISARTHLVRRIWYSMLEQCQKSGSEEIDFRAYCRCINTLSPPHSIVLTDFLRQPQMGIGMHISLQIQEGKYLGETDWHMYVQSWMVRCPDQDRIAEVRKGLEGSPADRQ